MQSIKIQHLVDWFSGTERPPTTLDIHPSKSCNMQCSFCKAWHEAKDVKKEIAYSYYEQLIKSAKLLGIFQVRILGKSEPFARSDILKIMQNIKLQNMEGYICTNGTMFNKQLVDKLIKIQWDRIEISLHGSSAYIHDKIVNKKGAFDRVVKNINMINYLKAEYKSDKPIIGITTTLNKLNYKDIPNIAKLAVLLKVNATSLNPLIPNRYNTRLKMTVKEIKDFKSYLEQSRKIIRTSGIDTNYHMIDTCHFNGMHRIRNTGDALLSVSCYFPWLNITVDENGYASQCSFCQGKENITKKSLEEIWHSSWFNATRKKAKKGMLFKECKGCCVPNIIENNLIREDLKNQIIT